jgi:acyl-homoserine-lactone acylase
MTGFSTILYITQASAHNADCTRAYSAGQWLKVPFSEAEIKADAAYRSAAVVSE